MIQTCFYNMIIALLWLNVSMCLRYKPLSTSISHICTMDYQINTLMVMVVCLFDFYIFFIDLKNGFIVDLIVFSNILVIFYPVNTKPEMHMLGVFGSVLFGTIHLLMHLYLSMIIVFGILVCIFCYILLKQQPTENELRIGLVIEGLIFTIVIYSAFV